MDHTVTYFFLGANTRHGFHSLYHQFCAGPGDTLHIIKSGPGTGKSTFMRTIGKEAEARGYDVEYILCSGDPESLDGVYIPALHTGWADGTDPHVLEPRRFGITGDYVDLGRFCRTELLQPYVREIDSAHNAYKACYTRAYLYLGAAGTLTDGTNGLLPDAVNEERLRRRARSKIQKELHTGQKQQGTVTYRFLRAISCRGDVCAPGTLDTLCTRLCLLRSQFGLEQLFFQEILAEVKSTGVPAICCPEPLDPRRIQAVILPAQGLAFLTEAAAQGTALPSRTIHLDAYLPEEPSADHKHRRKQVRQLLEQAYVCLGEAKQLHDELEQYYRPALDIQALNDYTQTVISQLFP